MTDIEYIFGSGVGPGRSWSSPADLDLAGTGVFDAVRLDFDGDGVADIAALDLDDDGVLDHYFTDPDGLGTWAQPL